MVDHQDLSAVASIRCTFKSNQPCSARTRCSTTRREGANMARSSTWCHKQSEMDFYLTAGSCLSPELGEDGRRQGRWKGALGIYLLLSFSYLRACTPNFPPCFLYRMIPLSAELKLSKSSKINCLRSYGVENARNAGGSGLDVRIGCLERVFRAEILILHCDMDLIYSLIFTLSSHHNVRQDVW